MFVQIPGYSRYLINDSGELVSTYGGEWRPLKFFTNSHGYLTTRLRSDSGKVMGVKAHKLVAMTFIGAANGLDVNHKNAIKTDNRLENLEYCSRSQNMRHAHDIGLHKATVRAITARNIANSRLTPADREIILKKLSEGTTQTEIAREFRISQSRVSNIKTKYGTIP